MIKIRGSDRYGVPRKARGLDVLVLHDTRKFDDQCTIHEDCRPVLVGIGLRCVDRVAACAWWLTSTR